MMKLTATMIAVLLLQGSPTFAGGFSEDLVKDLPSVQVVNSTGDSDRIVRPTLNSSEIAAIQYHESLSSRCQTRAGIFAVYPLRSIDTTCVVNGLPGFMLP